MCEASKYHSQDISPKSVRVFIELLPNWCKNLKTKCIYLLHNPFSWIVQTNNFKNLKNKVGPIGWVLWTKKKKSRHWFKLPYFIFSHRSNRKILSLSRCSLSSMKELANWPSWTQPSSSWASTFVYFAGSYRGCNWTHVGSGDIILTTKRYNPNPWPGSRFL